MTDEPIAWPERKPAEVTQLHTRTDKTIADELRALVKRYNELVAEAASRGIEVDADFDYDPTDYPTEDDPDRIIPGKMVVYVRRVL